MKYYLINLTFGYAAWFILIILIMAIYKLFKREKMNTINMKMALIFSCIGLISPTINFGQGKYKSNEKQELSQPEQKALRQIIQSCLSGEKIQETTHSEFWQLANNISMTQAEINEFVDAMGNPDVILLQKYFYADAIKTIQDGKEIKSQARNELEEKLLTKDQKNRNKQYLQIILNKKPFPFNGEEIILTEELCNTILDNIDYIFEMAEANFKILKNPDHFK
tara:strand:- start:120 stop:788 length:669 start_codon:yes stop_codon:yes gene_type:complete